MFKNVYSYRALDGENISTAIRPLCGYEYIVAGNGVFVESENEHMKAMTLVSQGDIRGLDITRELLVLKNGHIPKELLENIIAVSRNVAEEMFFR
ncbi:MAG: hypothetical protein QME32_05735 [Endomicrobiia bacterium]|nr:hypothetical protein [Endomicrobiia bacterium]